MFFFFQAEDGIRDDLVTGVQTCALPICLLHRVPLPAVVGAEGVPVERRRGGNEICLRHHGAQLQRQVRKADSSARRIDGKWGAHWRDSLSQAYIKSQGDRLPDQEGAAFHSSAAAR